MRTYPIFIKSALLFVFMLCGGILFAAECPELPEVNLVLCNPSAAEVEKSLGTPVKILDGVRTEGKSSASNSEFYETIKDQEYEFLWDFVDDGDRTVVGGCVQKFKLVDDEVPTCGASTLFVPVKENGGKGALSADVLKSNFKNQSLTWSDNCTLSDEIKVVFNDGNITGEYGVNVKNANSSVRVSYILKDKYGNEEVCNQTIEVTLKSEIVCPTIKTAQVHIEENCAIGNAALKVQVLAQYLSFPSIDKNGQGGQGYSPDKDGEIVKLYYDDKGTPFPKDFSPGEMQVYVKYSSANNLYCPVSVIVKESSTPPSCPELSDIVIDQATVSADLIETKIKEKVHSYPDPLDECTPNENLDVVFTGKSITAPYCDYVAYALSDFGKMRTCYTKLIVPKCPELPQLTKKFCSDGGQMPKAEMVEFLNGNKPALNYCSDKVVGVFDESKLQANYSHDDKPTIYWRFTIGNLTKECQQIVQTTRDYSISCVGKNVELEAETNCKAYGTNITLPSVTACQSYSLQWRFSTENNNTRREISTLNTETFKNGDQIVWHVNDWNATCTSDIQVVDHTKPVCSTAPSLGILADGSVGRDKVESMFGASLRMLGTDNCEMKSAEIDWDRTAWNDFEPNQSYKIYYSLTDKADNQHTGCVATFKLIKAVTPCGN